MSPFDCAQDDLAPCKSKEFGQAEQLVLSEAEGQSKPDRSVSVLPPASATFVLMKILPLLLALWFPLHACQGVEYERFEQDGKMGIRDNEGRVVVPAAFDALGWSDGGFFLVGQVTGYRKDGKWGLLNLQKKFITGAEYLTMTCGGGSRIVVSRNVSAVSTKYGCLNLEGQLIIPFLYDDIVPHDNRAIVMQKKGSRYLYGLVDFDHRFLLPVDYKRISPLGTLRYAVQNTDGKTALFSDGGTWLTPFDIDSLSSFHRDQAVLYQNGYQGLIDRSGNVVLKPIFRELMRPDSGHMLARRPHTWKVMDLSQHELHRMEADDLEPLSPQRIRFWWNGKFGLVDSLFRVILPPVYESITLMAGDKAIVSQQGKSGLIRLNGEVVLPLSFEELHPEGHLLRARWKEDGRSVWGLYDTVGVRKSIATYDAIEAYNGYFFPVRRYGFTGMIDRTGMERIACVYDSLLEINDGYSAILFKGLYGIITHRDEWVVPPGPGRKHLLPDSLYMERQGPLTMIKNFRGQIIYFTDNPLNVMPDRFVERLPDGTEKEINFRGQLMVRRRPDTPSATESQVASQPLESEGLILVRRHGKAGFVDNRGRLRIANRYDDAGDFREGRAAVRLLGKWGFIDASDQIVIHPIYDNRSSFVNGTSIVSQGGRYGLIDRQGRVLLELRYDSAWRHGSDIRLKENGMIGLATASGHLLLEPRFENLQEAGEHVIVSQYGRYGLVTREGLSVFPINYERLIYRPESKTFFALEIPAWETLEIRN